MRVERCYSPENRWIIPSVFQCLYPPPAPPPRFFVHSITIMQHPFFLFSSHPSLISSKSISPLPSSPLHSSHRIEFFYSVTQYRDAKAKRNPADVAKALSDLTRAAAKMKKANVAANQSGSPYAQSTVPGTLCCVVLCCVVLCCVVLCCVVLCCVVL